MRSIFHPQSAEEAVRLHHEIENSVYLAGGTEIMRLGSSISPDEALIDITSLPLSGIREDEEGVVIGALTTLEEIASSELVPEFIRKAASFDASLQLRNAATIGGNFALRRTDSYLLPSLLASEGEMQIMCTEGLKRKSIAEVFEKTECKALFMSFIIEKKRHGEVKRIARSSHSHAAITASVSEGIYAFAVSGSGIAYGARDSWKEIPFRDDLTGSADYKRYLASVIF